MILGGGQGNEMMMMIQRKSDIKGKKGKWKERGRKKGMRRWEK